ncbi:MAG: energy transducer TonB [Sphingobium sp.]|nr:energy transducer TonB [Sphingobium sp.]
MIAFLIAAAAASPSAVAAEKPVDAYAAPQQTGPKFWLLPDDYPSDIFRNGGQGTVGFHLYVDPNGKAYRCEVFASSGWPGLDSVTCTKALARARFIPARDDSGQQTYGRITRYQIWINPNYWARKANNIAKVEDVVKVAALPKEKASEVDVSYIAETDGRVSSCRASDETVSKMLADLACQELTKTGAASTTDPNGAKVRSVVTWKVGFTTGAVPAPPPAGAVFSATE